MVEINDFDSIATGDVSLKTTLDFGNCDYK